MATTLECISCHAPAAGGLFCKSCGHFVRDLRGTAFVASRLSRVSACLLNALLMVSTLGVGWLIWWFAVAPKGQNPGKAVVGLRVVRTDGRPPTTGLMLLRGLAGFFLTYLDGLWLLWDEDAQTLHDKVAGTVVLKAQGSGYIVGEEMNAVQFQLHQILREEEPVIYFAPALTGVRAITFFASSGSKPRFLLLVILTAGLLFPLVFIGSLMTGLVRTRLLVITRNRLIVVRFQGVLRPRLTEERSLPIPSPQSFKVTDSLWSGWLLEILGAEGVSKYAVNAPNRGLRMALEYPGKWRFAAFANSLESPSQTESFLQGQGREPKERTAEPPSSPNSPSDRRTHEAPVER